MRLHRFYINQKIENEVLIIDENLINQWLKVFRFKKGDRVILFNGDGFEYEMVFISFNKKDVILKLSDKKENNITAKSKISLFQSIIKKDNFEWIVEKCTEIGVANFQPIISERSEKKNLNINRLKIIAKEAVEQSGRNILPEIKESKKLSEILESINPDETLAFDGSGVDFSSKNFQLKSCNLFIGPEGGYSEAGIKVFKEKNIPIFSLGDATLRAETFSVAISSLLLF